MKVLLQSSTQEAIVFLLIQSSDHITGLTGASPTVTISKNGGSFSSPSGAVTEIANGWYKIAGNATDTNTLGPLIVHATATSADPFDDVYEVVAFNHQAATNLGLSSLPTASPAATGGLPTCDSSAAVKANCIEWVGGTIPSPGTTGVPDVNSKYIGGTSQTGRDIGASVLLSPGTGTGQVSLTSGSVTVGTNSDKTGYSLTQSFPTNFSALSVDSSGRVLLQPTQTGVTIPTVTATGSVTGSVGSVTGSVGSISGVTFPTNFGSTSIDSSGRVLLQPTQTGVTIPNVTSVGSVSGSVGSVTGAVGSIAGITFPTNFATISIDGSGRLLLQPTQTGVTIPTVTSAGSVTGSVGSVTGNVGGNVVGTVASVTGNVGGNVVGSVASVTNTVNANVIQILGTAAGGDPYPIVNSGSYGNAQLLSAVQNVQNNTFIATSIPQELAVPTSGSVTIQIVVLFSDDTGAAKNLDSGNPTVALVADSGTDRSSRLGTWSNPSTGKYTINYTSTSTDPFEGLHWDIYGTINSKVRHTVGYTQILPTISASFTSTDRTTLNNLANVAPAYAPNVDSSGRVLLQPTQPGVTIPTVTTVGTATNLTNAPTSGDFTATMKASLNSATPTVTAATVTDKTGYALTSAYDAAKTAAAPGAQMDLVNSPNATALSAIANAVWSATTRVLTAFGFTVNTNANSTEMAIKAKTDLIATNSMDSPNAVTAQATIAATPGDITSRTSTVTTAIAALPTTTTVNAIKAKTDLIATNSMDSPNAVASQGTISTLSSKLPTNAIADEAILTTAIAALPTTATVNAIKSKTDTIGTNAMDSANDVTAQGNIATILADVNAIPTSAPTAVQIRLELDNNSTKLAAAATASELSNAVTALESSINGINFSPSITIPPAVAIASQEPSVITIIRGDTLRVRLPVVGNVVSRTKLILTAKADINDSDDEAVFQVMEGVGLLRWNGANTNQTSYATLIVQDATIGNIDLELEPSLTSTLAIRDLVWDLQVTLSDGITSPISGTVTVVADVTRAVT